MAKARNHRPHGWVLIIVEMELTLALKDQHQTWGGTRAQQLARNAPREMKLKINETCQESDFNLGRNASNAAGRKKNNTKQNEPRAIKL